MQSAGTASVYACEVISYNGNHREEGIVEILEVSVDELKKMFADKKVTDGFTLAAVGML